MGEARVQTLLTNQEDALLFRRKKISASEARQYTAQALVDTGAVRSVVPVDVVNKLGIETWGETTAEYADGRKEVVSITEPIFFHA